jgi:hypothetical protein
MAHPTTSVMRRALTLTVLLLVAAAPAQAFRLEVFGPVKGNPANALADQPMDPAEYDRASRCDKRSKPGVVAFVKWMDRNAGGVFWGSYRCEKWGKRSASLHAENRAVDWHLDVARAADRTEARRVIELLLAPDRNGEAHALARRMGVEEIIWDCSYWGAGMSDFSKYSPCFNRKGKRVKNVNKTVAHRDHIHFGFTKAGAKARTTFWKSRKRR